MKPFEDIPGYEADERTEYLIDSDILQLREEYDLLLSALFWFMWRIQVLLFGMK